MRLDQGQRATIRPEKIVQYVLNPDHPVGKHKARLFASLLGITFRNPEPLLDALRKAAVEGEAEPGKVDGFGRRYVIDFPIRGSNEVEATLRSAWIVRGNEPPDLVTCFIL